MELKFTNADHTWQEVDGFVQACEVIDGRRVLYCSGQLSVDPQGKPLHPGDMRAQLSTALDNVENLLKSAGFGMSEIVRINVYTTDIDQCLKNWDVFVTRMTQAGCRPSCTLLGITRLAWPETMVEIEVTTVAG